MAGSLLIDMLVLIFGPSPYYIIGLEIAGAVIYVILWLPFYITKQNSNKKSKRSIKMRKINAIDYSEQVLTALKSGGVFLNSKLGDDINSMTMGWGSMSVYWALPVFIAPVRLSRYTHHMIDESGVFTVSIPLNGELRKELGVCGTKSGRDADKFELCNFTAQQGQKVDCPVIAQASLNIECKVVAKTLLDADKMHSAIVDKWYGGNYKDGDYHTLFFGEIVDCYMLD